MNNFENIKQPEFKSEQLLSLIDTVKWEGGYMFVFDGVELTIYTSTVEELETIEDKVERKKHFGEPAEYHASTVTGGFDIYLHETIPEADRKRVLFHEITEIKLRTQGYSQNDAHNLTLSEENKIFGERT